tara:strand:- start:11112 stop:11243 length:132 start_codon:yes stop_codon:yes gene_type:complete
MDLPEVVVREGQTSNVAYFPNRVFLTNNTQADQEFPEKASQSQ